MTDRQMALNPQKPNDWLRRPGIRLVRYGLVLILVAVAIWGSIAGWFRVCEVATSAADGVTTICTAQPDLTNAGVLAAAMLVILLLWPDVAEFSAFGLTLKKLVEAVGDDVKQNGRTARRAVDQLETARASLSRLEDSVAVQQTDLGRQFESIGSALDTIQQRQQRDAPSSSPSSSHLPGWFPSDEFRLETLAGALGLGDDQIHERAELIRGRAIIDAGELAPIRPHSEFAMLVGILIALFVAISNRHNRADAVEFDERRGERGTELAALLQLIQRLILSIIDGKQVGRHVVARAAATLWLLDEA